MDFRGNLEFDRSYDVPEAETKSGPTIPPGGNEDFPSSTTGGHGMEGE